MQSCARVSVPNPLRLLALGQDLKQSSLRCRKSRVLYPSPLHNPCRLPPPSCLPRGVYILPPPLLPATSTTSPSLPHPLRPDLVQKVHNHIILLDSQPIKVLAHDVGQRVLLLSAHVAPPRNGRRVQPDTPGLREHPLVVVADERRRGAQAVRPPVGVQHVTVEGGPLELAGGKTLVVVAAVGGGARHQGPRKDEGQLTPGALASVACPAASGAAAAAAATAAVGADVGALALVTSRRLEPALLATRRILPPLAAPDPAPPPPFFSFVEPVAPVLSALESSWPLRAAFDGAIEFGRSVGRSRAKRVGAGKRGWVLCVGWVGLVVVQRERNDKGQTKDGDEGLVVWVVCFARKIRFRHILRDGSGESAAVM